MGYRIGAGDCFTARMKYTREAEACKPTIQNPLNQTDIFLPVKLRKNQTPFEETGLLGERITAEYGEKNQHHRLRDDAEQEIYQEKEIKQEEESKRHKKRHGRCGVRTRATAATILYRAART
ncbi:hypothetical protein SADUNF_Sadunf08G0116700 [Salix dunnii]|uniref:Uncharacterized protein n=1 Tax=Salix dunnii TaxID=1413687 RepID=A0A835MU27_9ROSI|nr:hypothetical protein SADUNF_Sadunf08G0116700 [Salix dunnii]